MERVERMVGRDVKHLGCVTYITNKKIKKRSEKL